MTTRPDTADLPFMITRGRQSRFPGNGAVPDMNLCPREAACRKDIPRH